MSLTSFEAPAICCISCFCVTSLRSLLNLFPKLKKQALISQGSIFQIVVNGTGKLYTLAPTRRVTKHISISKTYKRSLSLAFHKFPNS